LSLLLLHTIHGWCRTMHGDGGDAMFAADAIVERICTRADTFALRSTWAK
jgi:hypothetical protein